uniref:Uncharacterized protein n=1 Tax=Rhizophora mucronata TaxID=61149 RepID=A0A2P2Q9T1_RHIMU
MMAFLCIINPIKTHLSSFYCFCYLLLGVSTCY